MRQYIYIVFFLLFLAFPSAAQIPKEANSFGNKFSILKDDFVTLEFENAIDTFSISALELQQDNKFLRISLGNEYTYSGKPGVPELPLIQQLIEIPIDAEVSITIVDKKVRYYSLAKNGYNNKIYPIQPSTLKRGAVSEFRLDSNIYFKNMYFANPPVDIVELGQLRGTQLARLVISPIEYNPVQNEIKICTYLKVKVSFKNANVGKTLYEKSRTRSPFHHFSTKSLFNKSNLFTRFDTNINAPIKYVIVSPAEYKETLQPFINWKREKGFNVITAYTDNPAVGTTKEEIKNYLQQLYNSATPEDPAPVFLLIVGDTPQINSFFIPSGQHHHEFYSHFTDLYYAEYTGDFFPELFYGRFPARDEYQLKNMIDKTIEYEKCEMPDLSYLNKVLLVAGLESQDIAPAVTNGFINYMKNSYFPINPIVDTSFYYNGTSHLYTNQIYDEINKGKSLVTYTAHCTANGWHSPSFSNSKAKELTNYHKYFLSVNSCCLSSKFDEPECFGEALLRAPNAGAIGVIGASNETVWEDDFYWEVGFHNPITINPKYNSARLGAFDRFFHTHNEPQNEWYTTQGEMVQAGNMAVTQSGSILEHFYWEVYNLLGDPSLTPYVGNPKPMEFSLSDSVEKGISSIVVQGSPYSYVSLHKNSTLLGVGMANETGHVTIKTTTPIIEEGYLQINAFKQFHKPFRDSVRIFTPQHSKVIVQSLEITDSVGNVIQKIKNGQRVKLNLKMLNVGALTGRNIKASIKNVNTNCLFIIDSNYTNSIEANETIILENAFELRTAYNLEDLSKVLFCITILADENYLHEEFISFTVAAPKLDIESLTIDSEIRPQENLNISVKVKNTGSVEASNVTFKISPNSKNIIISGDSVKQIGTLLPNEEKTIVYIVNCPQEFEGNKWIVVYSSVYSDEGFSSEKTFSIYTNRLIENFETENFEKMVWVNDLYNPWTIETTQSNIFKGRCSAKSGKIGNALSSSLSVSLDVIKQDSIRFAIKVSSEMGYDFLGFYIDGALIDKWSGNIGWKKVAFPVNSGKHTFKWKYTKDAADISGSDAAWLDEIEFPLFEVEGNISLKPVAQKQESQFVLYPNPANEKVNIEFTPSNNLFTIEIYNNTGMRFYREIVSNATPFQKSTTTLNLGNYPKGIYHIVIYDQEDILSRKFIISK